MPLVSLAVLGVIAMVGYRLYYAPFMRHQAIYAVGALVIYWFSVSGGCRDSEVLLCLGRTGQAPTWLHFCQLWYAGWPLPAKLGMLA